MREQFFMGMGDVVPPLGSEGAVFYGDGDVVPPLGSEGAVLMGMGTLPVG